MLVREFCSSRSISRMEGSGVSRHRLAFEVYAIAELYCSHRQSFVASYERSSVAR